MHNILTRKPLEFKQLFAASNQTTPSFKENSLSSKSPPSLLRDLAEFIFLVNPNGNAPLEYFKFGLMLILTGGIGGIGTGIVASLREDRLKNEREITALIEQVDINDGNRGEAGRSEAFNWLYQLSVEEVREVMDTFSNALRALQRNEEAIIKSLQSDDGRQQTIVLAELATGVTLVAKKGAIWLNNNQVSTMLMSCGKYLNTVNSEKYFGELKKHLNGLDLSGINLRNMCLDEANFACSNLTDADMRNVSLRGANMKKTQLIKADLREGTDLTGADLSEADLTNADLSNATLQKVNLTKTIVTNTKLHRANFNGTKVLPLILANESVDFSHVIMNNKTIGKGHWINWNFYGAEMHNMICSKANLTQINFGHADLTGLKMDNVHWSDITFDSETKLKDASITLAIPAWTQENITRNLNHFGNHTLLTTINSINDNYKDLKLNLMHQVIDSLKNVDVSTCKDALLDIFMNNPIYVADNKISEFIMKKFFIEPGNVGKLHADSPQLRLLLAFITRQPAEAQELIMLRINNYFVQLMALCANHPDGQIKEAAALLYDAYLELDELKGYKEVINKLNADTINGIRNIERDTMAFVFVRENNTRIVVYDPYSRMFVYDPYNGLILTQQEIDQMQNPGEKTDWSDVCFVTYDRKKKIMKVDMDTDRSEVFGKFPLFAPAYQHSLQQTGVTTLLTALKGLCKKHEDLDNYFNFLLKAYNNPRTAEKLVSPTHQLTLAHIFSPLLKSNFSSSYGAGDLKEIRSAYYQAIMKVFGLSSLTSPTVVAHTLFCLAIFFLQYSSFRVCGTEDNSLIIFRQIAGALIIKAHRLAPEIFETGKNEYADYKSWLMGMVTRNDCSAQLSQKMVHHIKTYGKSDFNRMFNRIKPPAW